MGLLFLTVPLELYAAMEQLRRCRRPRLPSATALTKCPIPIHDAPSPNELEAKCTIKGSWY